MQHQPGGRRRVSGDSDWQRGVGLTVLVSALWLATVNVHAQSLGELAAREQARRAAIASPSRVSPNAPRTHKDAPATPAPPASALVLLESRSTIENAEPTAPSLISETSMVVEEVPAVVSSKPAAVSEAPPVASGSPALVRGASRTAP